MTQRSRRGLSTRLSNPASGSDTPSTRPRGHLKSNPVRKPGNLRHRRTTEARGARHDSHIGSRRAAHRASWTARPRRLPFGLPGAPRVPQLAGGQGPVADDRGRLLGDCCRRRTNDSPDSHCVPNKTGGNNRDAVSHPRVNLRPPKRTTPRDAWPERQPLEPRSRIPTPWYRRSARYGPQLEVWRGCG